MHFTPLQSSFEHLFYALADIAFFVLSLIAASIIRGTKWRIHLNWLIPAIFANALTIVYRAVIDLHYFYSLDFSPGIYAFGFNCLYAANAIGLYGSVTLCITLKKLVDKKIHEIPHEKQNMRRKKARVLPNHIHQTLKTK